MSEAPAQRGQPPPQAQALASPQTGCWTASAFRFREGPSASNRGAIRGGALFVATAMRLITGQPPFVDSLTTRVYPLLGAYEMPPVHVAASTLRTGSVQAQY